MSTSEDDFKHQSSDAQVDYIVSLEQLGKLSDAKKILSKTLQGYSVEGNSKKINELLELIQNRKAYKKLYSRYSFCLDIITGNFKADSVQGLRTQYFDFNTEQKSLSEYEELLLSIFNLFTTNLSFVKNEVQLIKFIEKVIKFDDKSRIVDEPRVIDFKKSWLIKQLALFPRDYIVLNYGVVALLHSSEVNTAKQLYQYMVTNNIIISERLKYWIEVKNWRIENLYKKEAIDDSTQIFSNKIESLNIDELLSQSEKPFLEKGEYEEILNSYNLILADSDLGRSEAEEQLIISFGNQGITDRVNFYLENGFFKEAYKLVCEQINDTGQGAELDTAENLNWFYLALLALSMKNDYNESIEFTDKYEHCWKLLGAKAVDLWYLSAEANFYSGYFEKAKHYYLQINKFSPDYRLTKGRLEEIKAHK